MSNVVDNRVVEMRFDNKNFESNVATSMSTLEKLKQKLNLSGASKGLTELDNAAKKVNLSGLGNGIETMQAKFSALQVAGITALANITNSAVNAGKRIASALTIDPIKTGFSEYETQIGAVQTILANTESKGSTLQDVNRALDELNTYADKTIYNFTEMTRNIGTFTAAGVDLDKSVTSIKGIANLAAVSGSTSQQASVAMYQLSQALAAGKVQLMDWNSVVNAGMGGEVFQNALKRTATQMGTNVDALIEKYGSFRESLTQGNWLTAEVLTETLTQLSGAYSEADLIAQGYTEQQAKDIVKLSQTAVDAATKVKTFTQLWDTLKEAAQSGWTQSWETIIGDFEEAKDLLTGISNTVGDMIQSSADARNKVLSEGLSSGWKQLLNQGISDEEGFKDSIKSVAKEHGIAIDEMINDAGSFEKTLSQGWLTGDMLTESLDKMTQKVSGLSAEQLKEMGYTSEQVEELKKLNEAVKNGTVDMDDFAKKMSMASGRENMIAGFKNIFDGLMSVIIPVKEAFREIFPAMTGEQLYAFTEKFKDFTSHLKLSGEAAKKLKSTFKGVFSVLDVGVEAFKAIGKGAVTLISSVTGLGGGLLGVTGSFGDFLTNIRDSIVEGNIFGNVVNKLVGFLTKGISKVKEFGSSLIDSLNVSNAFQGFLSFFEGLWKLITKVGSAIGEAFGSIGKTIADAFGKGDILEVINSGLFAGVLLALRNYIKGLSDPLEKLTFLESLQKIGKNVTDILDGVKESLTAYQNSIKAETLLKIAAAVGILAASLFVISTIDEDKLTSSLGAIAVMFGELVGAMALLGKINKSDMKPLAGIVSSLSSIAQTIQMIGLSAAILILAGAMRTLASLDWDGVAKGLVGVAGLTGILVAAAKSMSKNDKALTKFAGQMILMSIAIGILSGVAKVLGSMSWEGLAKAGAGILGIVTMLVSAAKIMNSDYKAITKFAGQMILMSIAIGILSGVAKVLGSMSWSELARGGAGILGLVTMLVAAAKIMNSGGGSITKFAGQMLLMAASLAILAPTLKSLGSMSWESIGKGLVTLGVALAELAFGLHAMNGTLSGSAALLVAAGALAILAPTMNALGSMSVESIAKSLITLAAAFAVIGVAGALLSPLIPAILGLAGAFALFGVATLGIGAGLMLIATGFTALATAGVAGATAFVAALSVITTGVLGLIPTIARIIGEGIVEIANVIGESAPQLAESFLKLILGVMDSLATYTPQIVDAFANFFIGVLNSLSGHLPAMVEAAMNFIGSLFEAIANALNGLDTGSLLKGTIAVGIMTALMYALSGVVALIPSAMAGLAGVGVVIVELTAILAALGGLAQIPGLEWLISEGGNFLEKVGTAIGQFVGGIAGGVAQGITSSLPAIATDLSNFMTNLQPFLDGAKGIDGSVAESVGNLAKAILILTAADLIDGIASFITGGSSLSDFAEQLVPFGEAMAEFGEVVADIKPEVVEAAANAGKMLAEMASALPNSGGVAGFFAGENDLSSFTEQLVPFGKAMAEFSNAVTDVKPEAVEAAASAGKMMSELASSLPNSGGVVGFFSGNNDIGAFGTQLVVFGTSLKMYSIAVDGINTEAITNSATAAKGLVDLANNIQNNTGGLVSLFTGDNSLAQFGSQLVPFGTSMKEYSIAVAGINSEAIAASATAAKGLVEVANSLSNNGGLVSLFTGDQSLATFGAQLVPFGLGMKAYAIAVNGIDSESINNSVSAAKALVQVANSLSDSGGFLSLFIGDANLATFGQQLVPFGQGMKSYSEAVSGLQAEPISNSVTAAKALIQLANGIQSNSGGLVSLFTGDNTLAQLGQQLVPFGQGMKSYSEAVSGLQAEPIVNSATAAKALINVANSLQNSGGLFSLFTGDIDLGGFGQQLVPFGKGMKSYSEAVVGIDPASIVNSATAAKAMVKVANTLSETGGLKSLIFGGSDLGAFGSQLTSFGKAMAQYSTSVAGIDAGAVSSSASVAKQLINVIKSTSGLDTSGVSAFKSAVNSLASTNVSGFIKAFSGSSTQMVSAGSSMIDSIVKGFISKTSSLTTAANSMIAKLQQTIIGRGSSLQTAGSQIMSRFVAGINSQKAAITAAVVSSLSGAASSIRGYYGSFYSAGSYVASGLAAGIRSQVGSVQAAASAIAAAAEVATIAKLKINSPSKVFREIGSSIPEGFALGIGMMGAVVKKSVSSMTGNAMSGATLAMARMSELLNSDVDVQPTIRPVVDLSDVKSGVGAINGLFSNGQSVGVTANLNAISTMMNRRIQNGGTDEVVSAINKLRKDLGNMDRPSYTVNGVTYDDGSNVTEAVQTLVRALKIERRS